MNLEERIREGAEVFITCLPEDIPIKGNASAVDKITDKQTEDYITGQLESGNKWAWCHIQVTLVWHGIEASDDLGCCSYQDEEDFKKSDYFEDMIYICINRIREKALVLVSSLIKIDMDEALIHYIIKEKKIEP